MAMEKFIFTFKLSKGSIIIGWTKLVIASLISTTLFLGVIFSSALRDSLKKIFTSDGNDSSFKFYSYIILLLLFFIAYAVASFTLVVGSINHQRWKVLTFLIFDGFVTLLTLFLFYVTFFNFFVLLLIVIQFYLMFSVFSYWKQLHKEHETRIENQEHRKRSQQNNRKEPVAIAPSTGTESEIITANV